ncbi:30S ribosomal protein S16 [Buchnera aphidicola]|uniref:30S ribosomal protein S16 n=1 Tax=Buchnera aphidicola TaxID=9 RepID=UPI0031B7F49D
MVKIRLSLYGSKKKPFYKIIIANSKSPRDGKFIEKIGFYNPFSKDIKKKIKLNINRVQHWIKNGAITTKKVKTLIKDYYKNL